VTETIEEKSHRLLTTGHVAIRIAMPGHVVGIVRGDSGIHAVDLTNGRWSCSCEARVTCSHMQAVMLVTVTVPLPVGGGAK
jgi:hypothetical protein